MSSKEIVTIQVGNFANFIGTHWWNIQVFNVILALRILIEFL